MTSRLRVYLHRCRNPREWRLPVLERMALLAPRLARPGRRPADADAMLPDGISIVIPSRNGRELLAAQLPALVREPAAKIIVVDNGSDDGTARFLAERYPEIVVELSTHPLSFARAANRGMARAHYSHVCLLNNDMLVEPGFCAALRQAFRAVPDLFSATAQILFPPGVRREETGKAVMRRQAPTDFPVVCDLPIAGEDLSYVLYGSGGCSLYDTARLRALGGLSEIYEPAYVEDLDLGYRAWQRGWPTVFVAGARVEHRHRATTSRYYSPEQLDHILEINYLRFLATAVVSPPLYRRLWREALRRLRILGKTGVLAEAWRIPMEVERLPEAVYPEETFLALCAGDVAVFPGQGDRAPLVTFAEQLETPAPHLLAEYREVVLVRQAAGEAAYRAAVEQTRRKYR